MPGSALPRLPPLADFDERDPQAVYLAGDVELLNRADAVFLVEGAPLPVHTVLLKERCGALKALLSGGASGRAVSRGIPLTHYISPGRPLEVIMSDALPADSGRSLEGFTLKRVASFLRFLYHPAEVAALDVQLPGAAKSLSACARLAYALEVPSLLDALEARMVETVDSKQPTLQRLVDWACVAEECALSSLWTKCVRELAVCLTRVRKGLHPRATSRGNLLGPTAGQQASVAAAAAALAGANAGAAAAAGRPCPDGCNTAVAVHDVSLLQDLTPRTQLAVMATLVASLRKVAGDPSCLVPPESCLEAALPGLACLPGRKSPSPEREP